MNIKEKAKWLSKFYKELAENNNGILYEGCDVCDENIRGPNLKLNEEELLRYEVNPPKKIINLEIFLGKDIDMLFSDPHLFFSNKFYIGQLKSIGNDSARGLFYDDVNGVHYSKCVPRYNKWMHHNQNYCPIPEGLVYDIELTNGTIHKNIKNPSEPDWKLTKKHSNSIRAFSITGKVYGWNYRWE